MHCGSQASPPRATDWVERTAIGASFVCLVHCVGLPLLLAALPALSKLVSLPADFHLWVLLLAVPASGFALVFGAWQHRRLAPLLMGTTGLALLTTGAVAASLWAETILTLAGSFCLVVSHLANWRLRHRGDCRCSGPHG